MKAHRADPDRAALAAANQASWFATCAAVLGGSQDATPIGLRSRIPATYGGHDGEVRVVTLESLDVLGADVTAIADQVVDTARQESSIASLTWWAGDTESDRTLGSSLLARGFSWSFQPAWMHLDPASDIDISIPDVPGISISPVVEDVDWNAPDLPNYDRRLGRAFRRLTSDREDGTATAVFAATTADRDVVGLIAVHAQVPVAVRRVAGIYDCGVEPRYQRRGIGRALTATAVHRALAWNCTDLTLNATPMGAPVYGSVGFRPVGGGQTWSISRDRWSQSRSPAAEIRLVEAIGRGTLDALDPGVLDSVDLDARLWCGRTAIEVAALVRNQRSARRLAELGATVDLISAWDLGWRDEIPDLIATRPDLVNRRGGEHLATPLHSSIDRNDRDLFDLLLRAGPDLTVTDGTFNGTAVDWARHIGRPDLLDTLQEAQAERGPRGSSN